MVRIEGLTEILGIPIGAKREPRSKGVDALRKNGVVVHPITVSRLRMRDTSGVRTADRLNCARVLEENSAERKNRFFLILATHGLIEREHGTQRDRARFNSTGYTELVAQALGERPQVVRRCIRAMRADLVCESLSSPGPDLVQLFCVVAERYLSDFPHTSSHLRPEVIKLIDQEWDHRAVVDFYKKLYQHSTTRSVGVWASYEMEVSQQFYIGRLGKENTLTSLDKAVLNSHAEGKTTRSLVEELIGKTGIPVDDEVIFYHRNLLVYGRPTPRMI